MFTRAINLVDKPSYHHQIVSTCGNGDLGYIHIDIIGNGWSIFSRARFGMARMVLVPVFKLPCTRSADHCCSFSSVSLLTLLFFFYNSQYPHIHFMARVRRLLLGRGGLADTRKD